jgi:hypothetical protein
MQEILKIENGGSPLKRVTLGPEQGELGANFSHLGALHEAD